MKHDVTHSCGHTITHYLYGKRSDRESKGVWLAGRPCTDCWKLERQKGFDRENEASKEASAGLRLPELTGSEKQVAWAATLRLKAIGKAAEFASMSTHLPAEPRVMLNACRDGDALAGLSLFDWLQERSGHEMDPEDYQALLEFVGFLRERSEASWWINRRDVPIDLLGVI